jgi:hypothetical protein
VLCWTLDAPWCGRASGAFGELRPLRPKQGKGWRASPLPTTRALTRQRIPSNSAPLAREHGGAFSAGDEWAVVYCAVTIAVPGSSGTAPLIGGTPMSQRIALRCPNCQKLSHRSMSFVRVRSYFVCNFCHEMVKIDHHEAVLALTRHPRVTEADAHILERPGGVEK